ncbi:MAG TPA: DUF3500 domain-containing protein, partial [Gemmatimonadaceae bacterium]|nr:DUF3500 domain-containing protein [Gemmatimonadaceae bacterium]
GQMPVTQAVNAANAFLATLTAQQKSVAVYAFNDDKQRANWSNFPTGIVQRGGIKLGDLSAEQRSAAMKLLSTVLSPKGYEKIQQIMDADEVLKQTDSGAQGRLLFGKDLYYISFLGQPSTTTPWLLQFGGHHLALNITIAGARGILTPTLTGAQPALYTANGKTIRPLGAENDKAVALLKSLDAGQQKQAILSSRLADLVLGPGQDNKTIQPEGLKAASMNEQQRAQLLDLIAEWSGIIHDAEAATRMAEIKAGINDTWFAWSGPTDVTAGKNISSYYRIQGPQLVIEFAPQTGGRQGGDPTMHIHTMYRDPTNDYARKLIAK